MSKQEPKKPKSHEQFPEIQKHQKKINLVTIETTPSCPIQEVMCREEYQDLFKCFWDNPS